jgi:rhodanese-related sulfurtransferase
MAKRFLKPVLREAVIVALAGTVLAFAANALSPKGIDLRRTYLADKRESPAPTNPKPRSIQASNAVPIEEDLTVAHLKEKGLQTMDTPQVQTLTKDVRCREGSVILIDVRSETHYQEGHIPGASNFDFYYHLDQVAQVVPACQTAQQVIVYCNGGKCDTSEAAALFLRDTINIPGQKLYVYTGGIADWEAKGLPVEIGPQNSGKLKDSAHAR